MFKQLLTRQNRQDIFMQRVRMYLFSSWARLHRIRKCVSSGPMSDFVPQLWTSPFDAWHAAGRQDSNNGLCRDGRWQRRKHHHLRSPTRGTGRHCCEIRSEPLPPDEVHPRAVARTQPRAHGGCALGAEHTDSAPPPRRQGRTPTARPSCTSCRWSDPPAGRAHCARRVICRKRPAAAATRRRRPRTSGSP